MKGGDGRREREGEEEREREKAKKSFCFFLRSTKIRSSIFVGARGKVGLRNESYAWVPKS